MTARNVSIRELDTMRSSGKQGKVKILFFVYQCARVLPGIGGPALAFGAFGLKLASTVAGLQGAAKQLFHEFPP